MALLLATAGVACGAGPEVAAPAPTDGLIVNADDVALFYRVYDAADGRPGAEELENEYLKAGSDGLRRFAELRRTDGAAIAAAIARRPEVYEDARRHLDILPAVVRRSRATLGELRRVYPEARLPAVTIAIGRGRPVAVGSPKDGVMIGLEALCAVKYFNPNMEDRFVHVIAHEFVHVQQAKSLEDGEQPTVLEASLVEGAAEFVGELISGEVGFPGIARAVKGRELELETAFAADLDKRDLSAWLFNGTAETQGDLGYWVGYRIVKAYYQRAPDKRAALREILNMTDARAFLARSGWRPGLELK